MQGHHYSSKVIKKADTIVSGQTTGLSYKLVWGIYKQVADELGIYMPVTFGYAYPTDVARPHFQRSDWLKHQVEAPDEKVTTGNLDYSLMVTMSEWAFADRNIKDLAQRLADREQRIRKCAESYFTKLGDPDKIELISDCWVVQ